MPAEPQHSSASAISSQLQAGDRRAAARAAGPGCPGRARGGRRRGRRPSPAAGAAARPGRARRAARRRRGPCSANARGPLGVRRVVGEQLGVLLHRRAAAGGVDHDVLDAGRLEGVDRAGGRSACASGLAAVVHRQRPAAALLARDHDLAALGASTRAVAALTPGKNAPCTQPVSMPTTARRSARGPATRSGSGSAPGRAAGRGPPSPPASAPAARSSPLRRTTRLQPGALVGAAAGRAAAAAAAGRGTARRSASRSARSRRRRGVAALDLRPGRLDQLVVLHARTGRRSRRPCSRGRVEVLDHRVGHRLALEALASSGRSGRAGESISSPHST